MISYSGEVKGLKDLILTMEQIIIKLKQQRDVQVARDRTEDQIRRVLGNYDREIEDLMSLYESKAQ